MVLSLISDDPSPPFSAATPPSTMIPAMVERREDYAQTEKMMEERRGTEGNKTANTEENSWK